MHAVTIRPGAELVWAEHPNPEPGPHQVLVAVETAGINAADLLQRQGFYPAPPGSPPDIPGMEFAGVVLALGSECRRLAVGDRVMGLLGGGAQAELALADEDHLMVVPDGVSWPVAGGFVEAYCTAYDALVLQGGLSVGDRVLVTGAAGGVGTAGVQLAVAAGAEVVASARHREHHDDLRALGAEPFVPDEALTHGPFDLALELVAGQGLTGALDALATGGRVVVIGVGAGARVELDLLKVMQRRAVVRGSTLRARTAAEKSAVLRPVEAHVVSLLAVGRLTVPVAATFPLAEAAAAYERFGAGAKFGKVVLTRS